jgi:hypothetical protein
MRLQFGQGTARLTIHTRRGSSTIKSACADQRVDLSAAEPGALGQDIGHRAERNPASLAVRKGNPDCLSGRGRQPFHGLRAGDDNSVNPSRRRGRLAAMQSRAADDLRAVTKHIEDLIQCLQSFGIAPLALLLLPVLITALARNVTLVLATSLLSFTSLMLLCL